MRPIDADALKESIQEYTHTLYHDDRPDLDYEYIDIDDLIYVINSAPTVDEISQGDLANEVLEQIIAEINTSNRGTCDYYIVDRIEEIINEYQKGGAE